MQVGFPDHMWIIQGFHYVFFPRGPETPPCFYVGSQSKTGGPLGRSYSKIHSLHCKSSNAIVKFHEFLLYLLQVFVLDKKNFYLKNKDM